MENKTAVERWEEYMKTDEVSPSYAFVRQFAKQFPPFTAHGLNQLPHVLMPAVAICCEEYASLQCAEMKKENERLNNVISEVVAANKNLAAALDEWRNIAFDLQKQINELPHDTINKP